MAMRQALYVLIALTLLGGCTTITIKAVDYCHNTDGSYRVDDPKCQDVNHERFYDLNKNSVRY